LEGLLPLFPLLIWANCGHNSDGIALLYRTGEADVAKKIGASITKQDAVRRALTALGKQAPAKDIQKHVKEAFGIEMTIDHIYNAKSNVLAKRKKAAKKHAAPKPAPEKPSVQAAPAVNKKTGGISIEDVEAAKALVGRVGAEQLHSLIDLLAK
jgi:hypothetical protein